LAQEAFSCWKDAIGRIAVERADLEVRKAEQAKQEQERELVVVEEIRMAVEGALSMGGHLKCPNCNYRGEKDDACMHISCGICSCDWCYCCGHPRASFEFSDSEDEEESDNVSDSEEDASSDDEELFQPDSDGDEENERNGENREDRNNDNINENNNEYNNRNRRNRSNYCPSCDDEYLNMESYEGWDEFAVDGDESDGFSALHEFHRRRMAYFLKLVKGVVPDGDWAEFRRAYPDILEDTPTPGRRICWDEIGSAEPPLFGKAKRPDQLRWIHDADDLVAELACKLVIANTSPAKRNEPGFLGLWHNLAKQKAT